MRFLEIDAVAEFLVPYDLVLHPHFDVFPFVSFYAFGTKLLPKLSRQLCIARQETRLKHRGLCQHIAIGLRDRFFDRPGRMSNFEAAVPEQIENLLHHFLEMRRNLLCPLPVEKHDIDIAKWIQLASAVSAKGNQCQGSTGRLFGAGSGERRSEDVS